MRTGPGQNYPGTWLYRAARPADPGDRSLPRLAQGSRIRTAPPAGCWSACSPTSAPRSSAASAPRPLHEAPDAASPVRFRAEPGRGRPDLALRRRLVPFRRARPRRLYPRRPDLGRRARRDDPLTDSARSLGYRRFLRPGRQGVRRRGRRASVPLTLDAPRSCPARSAPGGGFRLEFVGPPSRCCRRAIFPFRIGERVSSSSSSCRSAKTRRGTRYEAVVLLGCPGAGRQTIRS